jgi:hypothetical protein
MQRRIYDGASQHNLVTGLQLRAAWTFAGMTQADLAVARGVILFTPRRRPRRHPIHGAYARRARLLVARARAFADGRNYRFSARRIIGFHRLQLARRGPHVAEQRCELPAFCDGLGGIAPVP